MTNRYPNTLLVLLVTLVVAGVGYYKVGISQPAALQGIEDQKKLARLQQTQLEQLFVEEASSSALAEETMRKWHARYKYMPARLSTPDVIQYLEGLSRVGFEQFNVQLVSRGSERDYSYYLFEVSGTAFYKNLYQFVWQLENNRAFYQVSGLDVSHTNVFVKNETTGLQKQLNMVNFSMKLKAFYAGTTGLSAPEEDDSLPAVPEALLPPRDLPHDSFYPIVRTDLPPNDELLVNVEKAVLLSILGNRAVFQDDNGQHVVREGDEVYLGRIVRIDPYLSTVRVSLNKGGNVEVLDVKMEGGEPYKKAQQSDVRLIPLEKQ